MTMRFIEVGVLALLWASLIGVNSDEVPVPDTYDIRPMVSNGQFVSDRYVDGLVFNPTGEHKYTLIYLHGYNKVMKATKLVSMLRGVDSIKENWKIIMPMAPIETFLNGTEIRQWGFPVENEEALAAIASKEQADAAIAAGLDIDSDNDNPDGEIEEDSVNYRKSSVRIRDVINKEIANGIPSKHIVLGGFSQGGAIAYLTGLEYEQPLLGLFGIACWLPLTPSRHFDWDPAYIRLYPARASLDLKILHLHGRLDAKIPVKYYGQPTVKVMRDVLGLTIESDLTFNVGHDLIQAEGDRLAVFLAELVAADLLK